MSKIIISNVMAMALLFLLFLNSSVRADDIPITVTGNLLMIPCTVNNGNTISVDFKTVNVDEIDDAAILTTIPVSCSPYTSVFIRVLGETLNWNPESYENILKASLSSEPNYDGFGIQLWQGDTRDTQLLIGSGKGGQYGSPLIDGMSENGNGSFSFTFLSTLYNRDSKPLEAGSFYAHATLDIFYF